MRGTVRQKTHLRLFFSLDEFALVSGERKLVFASRQRRDKSSAIFCVYSIADPFMSLLRNEASASLHSSYPSLVSLGDLRAIRGFWKSSKLSFHPSAEMPLPLLFFPF